MKGQAEYLQIESLAGSFDLYRPYFYCKKCNSGFYPLDEALGLSQSPKHYDIQALEAWLSGELPFETAAEAFSRCTGDTLSTDQQFPLILLLSLSFAIYKK